MTVPIGGHAATQLISPLFGRANLVPIDAAWQPLSWLLTRTSGAGKNDQGRAVGSSSAPVPGSNPLPGLGGWLARLVKKVCH